MTVNYVGGVDYNQYQRYNNNIGVQNGQYVTYSNATQSDAFVSNTGETCTDGKDDGKIGFFSAIGNAIKGIGKTIGNGIKGMFTGKDGKFSLGKTLLSIGTAALCIAVPAVGVAACVVGGAMGAVQVGKGIYNAATATTDAEAKMAWQDVGGGAFTVAASVVGAKAGMKAVGKTSTATNGLASLDDTATMGAKIKAFGNDMVSSTKNQVGNLKTSATAYAKQAKSNFKEFKSTYKEVKAEYKALYNETPVGKAEAALKAAKAAGNADDIAAAEAALKTAKAAAKAEAKQIWGEIADDVKGAAKGKFNEYAIKAKTTLTKENAQAAWNTIKANIKNFNVKQAAAKLTGTAKSIWADLSTGKLSYPEVVGKYGFENVAQVIQYMGGTIYASEAIE